MNAPPPGPFGSPPNAPVPSWGAPTAYATPTAHPRGTLVLVLGIVGMVCAGLLAGVPAWILGASALGEIRRSPGRFNNEGMVQAGMWLGVASTVLSVLAFAGMLVVFAVGGYAEAMRGATSSSVAAPVVNSEIYVSKNGLVRAHYPAQFAARSVDEATVVISRNTRLTDETVVLVAVPNPISDELTELVRIIDAALLQNYSQYVESSRRASTCSGTPGLETRGTFVYRSTTYSRWSCTFVREGKAYQFSFAVKSADAPGRDTALRTIVDATEFLTGTKL